MASFASCYENVSCLRGSLWLQALLPEREAKKDDVALSQIQCKFRM
jgi:hypothetical protein